MIELRSTSNRLGRPSTQEEQALGYQAPKSNKLLNFTSTYHSGELKPMHQMQWQGHTECPSPSLSNPTKATNAREENERKNERRTRRTPRSRSKGFPSLRGESDWWKCGSRSPLSFPSRTSKNHWRD